MGWGDRLKGPCRVGGGGVTNRPAEMDVQKNKRVERGAKEKREKAENVW